MPDKTVFIFVDTVNGQPCAKVRDEQGRPVDPIILSEGENLNWASGDETEWKITFTATSPFEDDEIVSPTPEVTLVRGTPDPGELAPISSVRRDDAEVTFSPDPGDSQFEISEFDYMIQVTRQGRIINSDPRVMLRRRRMI